METNNKNNSFELENARQYLYGHRDKAVLNISHKFHERNIDNIIPRLKEEIINYVSFYHPNFKGDVKIKGDAYKLLTNFNTIKFFDRKWKFEPYYIDGRDYELIQDCIKNPIYAKRYDYTKPIGKLENTLEFNDSKNKNELSGEVVKTDTKFYLSDKEDMIFSKVINLKYKPKKLKFLREVSKNLGEEEKSALIYREDLFERTLSISEYVLLGGDPNMAMPFMRYDNGITPHSNVYIGNDRRRYVISDVAESPHFHFQNEQDALLCLRKFNDDDGKIRYRTGRCNAIDCRHLKQYLVLLDKIPIKSLKMFNDNGVPFYKMAGMPFYKMVAKDYPVKIDLDKLIDDFASDKILTEKNYVDQVRLWQDIHKKSDYEKHNLFGDLIRSLDFIEYVCNSERSALDPVQRRLLSELEVTTASAIMDAINLNTSKILSVDKKPKYEIEYRNE